LEAEALPSPAVLALVAHLAPEELLVVAAADASLVHVLDDAAQAVPIRSRAPEVLDLAPKAVGVPPAAAVAVHRVQAAVDVAGVAAGAETYTVQAQAGVAGVVAGAVAGAEARRVQAQAGVAGAGVEEAHTVEAEETSADHQIAQAAAHHVHTSQGPFVLVMAAGDHPSVPHPPDGQLVEARVGGWGEHLCWGAGHTGSESVASAEACHLLTWVFLSEAADIQVLQGAVAVGALSAQPEAVAVSISVAAGRYLA
jgi:hypothetical protein